MCHWPSGKGPGLPIRSGRFDSDIALFFDRNLQVWANGKPAAFEAVDWRFESFRLCSNNKTTLRSSNCWSLRLALNQKLAGSIPASGAVAVLYWFRNLAVNQVYVGSIPIGHPVNMEGIRPDARPGRRPGGRIKARAAGVITRLKTVSAKHASGFESLAFRLEKQTK